MSNLADLKRERQGGRRSGRIRSAAGRLSRLPGLFPASRPTWALLPSLSAAQVLSSLWRGAAEQPQEGYTAALSGLTDQDSNHPPPRQGATLDARVPSSGPAASPSWPHTAPSSRPPPSRAGFCLEGVCSPQPLVWGHLCFRSRRQALGCPRAGPPADRTGSLSDEPVLMPSEKQKSIANSGLLVPPRPRSRLLSRLSSRQSHLWGEVKDT